MVDCARLGGNVPAANLKRQEYDHLIERLVAAGAIAAAVEPRVGGW